MRISHFVTDGHTVTVTNIYICHNFLYCIILRNNRIGHTNLYTKSRCCQKHVNMSITEKHINGLRDMLLTEANTPVLLQLAKSVTKNLCNIDSPEGKSEAQLTNQNK